MKSSITALALLSATAAMSQPPPEGEDPLFPSGGTIGRAMAVICNPQSAGAKIAAESRRLGQPLAAVLEAIPVPSDPLKSRLVRGMRMTVEDSYRYPQLAEYTMFFFRSKVCFRELAELRQFPRIDASVAALEQCQRSNGEQPGPALLACIGEVVERIAP